MWLDAMLRTRRCRAWFLQWVEAHARSAVGRRLWVQPEGQAGQAGLARWLQRSVTGSYNRPAGCEMPLRDRDDTPLRWRPGDRLMTDSCVTESSFHITTTWQSFLSLFRPLSAQQRLFVHTQISLCNYIVPPHPSAQSKPTPRATSPTHQSY